MKPDPVTGVMPREEFEELKSLPAGQALKRIRKYDPLWGVPSGAKVRWKIVARREAYEYATIFVTAGNQKEAETLADEIIDKDEARWEGDRLDTGTVEFQSVEPTT